MYKYNKDGSLSFCCGAMVEEAARNHCCLYMAHSIHNTCAVGYGEIFKEYFIESSQKIQHAVYRMAYCPWCGATFPPSLRDEYMNILEKEYGIDDPWSKEQEKLVPEEFKSDAWWKKRKL